MCLCVGGGGGGESKTGSDYYYTRRDKRGLGTNTRTECTDKEYVV